LTNKIYYYRTYSDLNIRKVELDRIDFSSGSIRFLKMSHEQEYIDVTDEIK